LKNTSENAAYSDEVMVLFYQKTFGQVLTRTQRLNSGCHLAQEKESESRKIDKKMPSHRKMMKKPNPQIAEGGLFLDR
jgi:hypothetical protein